jgi:hypothetical protein
MSVAPTPTSPSDLETRVETRKRALIAEIIEYKQNSSRASSVEAIGRAKARLNELAHIVKLGVADGGATFSPATTRKLDEWTKK